MPTYLLSVHHREGDDVPTGAEMQRAFAQVDELNDRLRSEGAWVYAGGLEPPDAARVVRGEGDATVVADGPAVRSAEHLGGFWIVDVEDRDTATAWARRASAACLNPVEVRPFADFSDVAPSGTDRPEFLLSVHMGSGGPHRRPVSEEEQRRSWRELQQLEADMQATGTWRYSARLAAPDSASVVTVRDGDAVETEGPFAERDEHLAGFYVIAADDLDEALDWGRRVTACVGAPIEVRPFQSEPAT